MPVAKDNICKKSSQFHFVNEYLYQPMVDEDGNNSTLYADRYYPEGYEPGVPFDMAEAQPEKPNLQYNGRRTAPAQQSNRRPIQQQRYNPDRPNRERQQPNENRRVKKLVFILISIKFNMIEITGGRTETRTFPSSQ